MSQTNEMVKLAITALEDKKGEDIRSDRHPRGIRSG